MQGYKSVQRFRLDADLGQVVAADMSTIYTFLKDLQEHGLIRGERVTVGARPPRTVFSLTSEAEPLFLDWLRRPVARMREVRMDFLLKLYFARQLGATEAKALIKAQTAACRDYLERQKVNAQDLDTASFESLVLESKLTAAESILDWLNRIARRAIPRKRSRVKVDKRPAMGRKVRQ